MQNGGHPLGKLAKMVGEGGQGYEKNEVTNAACHKEHGFKNRKVGPSR